MQKVTVLVSACGSTSGINIIQALREQDEYDVVLVGAEADPDAAGLRMVDHAVRLPMATSYNFADEVLAYCQRYNVDVAIPTHSKELVAYSSIRVMLATAGVRSLLPAVDVIQLCDDKVASGNFIENLDLKRPQPIPNPTEYPVFIKSRFGSGALFAHTVHNADELAFWCTHVPEPVVQELILGQEYTVNMISDEQAQITGMLPIRRLRVRGGLSVLNESERMATLEHGCSRIAQALRLVGPCNIQAIVGEDGEVTYIEVNPRFASGSMPTAIASGLNIPLILLKLVLGDDATPTNIQEGVRLCRYWAYQEVKRGGA